MKEVCSLCFKNLGVGSRVKIYRYLERDGEKNVSDVTEFIKLKQPTVSYHLNEMLISGLVKRRNAGKETFYSVNKFCPHDNEQCVVNHYVENK